MTEWTTRNILEWQDSLTAYFVTFTYMDEELPLYDVATRRPSLHYRDMTLFWKRFRKYQKKTELVNSKGEKKPLRYFYVGEYGSKDQRPHYHAIIYNIDWDHAEHIMKYWKHGIVDYKPLESEAAITYTAKYAFKNPEDSEMEFKSRPYMSSQLGLKKALEAGRVENGLIDMGTHKVPIPHSWIKHFYSEDHWNDIRIEMDEKSFLDNWREEVKMEKEKPKSYPTAQLYMKHIQVEKSKTRYKNGIK